ncbi:fatty acid desaturase family protein [Streptomyces sp. NPDC059076]|uniref:fatty acid desaturase family protein n=1 Tax=unclassified Streptomyces TaxID=2593676 RepID=UPI0036C58160
MDAQLHPMPSTTPADQGRLARAAIRGVRREIDGRIFAAKLAVLGLLLLVGAWLIVHGTWWGIGSGVVLTGLMYAHALELQHEALHSIGFRGKRANVVAGVLVGLPMLSSFAGYHASHMRHHRDLGTPANREFFDYGDQYGTQDRGRLRTALLWGYRFSMVAHYCQFVSVLVTLAAGRPLAEEKPATLRKIRRDYAIMVAAIVGAVVVSIAMGSLFIVWFWLVPLVFVAAPAHAAIELPEHYRCETDTTDVFRNTRTIRSNWLMAWYTNGNNFHVEHHLMPSMPIVRLGALHEVIAEREVYRHDTYRGFFRSLRRPPA